MLLGLLVVIAIAAGCFLVSLGGAPAATIAVSDMVEDRISDIAPITLPDSSSSVTMTVGELTNLLSEVFRHDEQMQRDALDTVRDVAVSADVATSVNSVSSAITTGIIGIGVIAVLVITVMAKANGG